MFGHQDEDQQNNVQQDGHLVVEPPHIGDDAAAAGNVTNPALPPADNQPGAPAAPKVDPFAEDDGPVQAAPALPPSANDLLDIKQHALQQLSPLVGHLEQSPEEKFRTTMMMIQASDDQSLIKVAYEAAEQITDEKAKAQALLDIVNEINYFTHQGNGEAEH